MENINSSGFCLFCTASTNLVCHRCGDFYCSKECQFKDWQRHRYICFSIPPLVYPNNCSVFQAAELAALSTESLPKVTAAEVKSSAAAIGSKLNIDSTAAVSIPANSTNSNSHSLESDKKNNKNGSTASNKTSALEADSGRNGSTSNKTNAPDSNGMQHKTEAAKSNISNGKPADLSNVRPTFALMPPSNSVVYITGFMSANRCFLRDANENAQQAFFDITKKVNWMGVTLPKKFKIKALEYAVIQYNGRFYRGKPIFNKQYPSRFVLLDEGIIVPGKKIEMREICGELLVQPFCSLQVQLKDVPNFLFTEKVGEFLKQFEGEKFIATYEKNGHIELQNLKTQKSLKTQILEFCGHMEIFGKQTLKTMNNAELNASTVSLDKCAINVPANKKPAENSSKTEEIEKLEDSQQIKSDTNSKKAEENIPVKKTEELKIPQETVENLKNSTEKLNSAKIQQIEEIIEISSQIKSDRDAKNQLNHDSLTANSIIAEKAIENVKDVATLELNTEELKILKECRENLIIHSAGEISSTNDVKLPPLLIPPFEIRRLSAGNNKEGLDAVIVDNANVSRGIIGAFDSIHFADLAKLCFHLSQFTDNQIYKPIVKEFVIAKYENVWQRAKVMEIKQNLYTVMFLDYSNVATINELYIRRYPAGLTVPCHTSICLIEGFPHRPTKRQIDFLEGNLKMNSRLRIDSVSYLQEMALIRCNTLIDELKKYQ